MKNLILNLAIFFSALIPAPQALAKRVAPVTCGASWTVALNRAENLSAQYIELAATIGTYEYTSAAARSRHYYVNYVTALRNSPDENTCHELFRGLYTYNNQLETVIASTQAYIVQLNQQALINAQMLASVTPTPSALPAEPAAPAVAEDSVTRAPAETTPSPSASPTSYATPVLNDNTFEQSSGIQVLNVILR